MSQQASTNLDHLVVKLSDPKVNISILKEWIWLIGGEKRTFLIAACGSVFLEDTRDGTIHYLDVSAEACSPIADTAEAFDTLLANPSFVERYLWTELVDALQAKGVCLKRNQIYSFRQPLSLGGQVTLENIDVCDVEVHFSFAGKIARQLIDVPAGTALSSVTLDGVPAKKPWWRFW